MIPRGAGTSLCGGAIPQPDAVVVGVGKLNRVLEIDYPNRSARVEAGVTNLAITGAVSHEGYFYAPDPSSQLACTIAGNIAMNSGGAHCLKYGVTTNNVLGVRLVMVDGTVVDIGGSHMDAGGLDLLGLLVGSEGQLGIVTEATVRILRAAEGAQPVLFGFDTVEAAGDTVSAIIAAGIVPVAIEYMDKVAIEICEAFAHAGYPLDVEAMLIVEVEGSPDDMTEQLRKIVTIAREHGVKTIRESRSALETAAIWKGRKSAFGATGRVADYICMDGTIPTGRLPEVLRRIREITDGYGLKAANVFHAGDGNLHPLVLYDINDRRRAGEGREGRRGYPEALRRGRWLPHRRARGRHREARPDAVPVHARGSRPADARARGVRSGLAAQSGEGVPAGRSRDGGRGQRRREDPRPRDTSAREDGAASAEPA